MANRLSALIVALVLEILLISGPARADNHGLATQFDWIAAWGTINPWRNPQTPETGTPSLYHAIKGSIFSAIEHCGAQGKTDFSSFEVYTGDLSGTTVYFVDGHKFFPAQTNCVKQILQECVQGQGCYMGIDSPLVASEVTETTPCASAGCKHMEYASSPIWLDIVVQGQWHLISYNDFLNMREANKDTFGGYKYMQSSRNNSTSPNSGNVLSVQIGRPSACTVEEMDHDNDGTPDSPCVKYYQYDGGHMVDLHSPQATPASAAETFDTAMFQSNAAPATDIRSSGYDGRTTNSNGHGRLVANGTDVFSRLVGKDMTGDVYSDDWRGITHSEQQAQAGRASEHLLADNAPRAYEIRDAAAKTQLCLEFKNEGTNSVFIPTKTDSEFISFVKAVVPDKAYGLNDLAPEANQLWDVSGTVPHVSGRACERRYTKWVGFTSCSQVNVPCNSSMVITAERRCQRSSGAYGQCGECANLVGAADPEGVPPGGTPADVQSQCFFQTICEGPACPVDTDGEGGGQEACKEGCPPKPHNSCISAEAKVLMADGSYKKLGEIRIGDLVMGFKKVAPGAALYPTRITKIKTTPVPESVHRNLYELNGIPMTAAHSVMLENGRAVPASNVRMGDKMLGMSGEPVKVTTSRKTRQTNTVYSVWFDDADGFVVEGVRLLGQ